MRKIFTIFLSIFLVLTTANNLFAQDTLVAWTFPSTSSDSLADKSIAINSTAYIVVSMERLGLLLMLKNRLIIQPMALLVLPINAEKQ